MQDVSSSIVLWSSSLGIGGPSIEGAFQRMNSMSKINTIKSALDL